MKRILVTGGAGYIGSHTCKQLYQQGYKPIVFDNLSEGNRWAVRYGPFIEGSLESTDLLRRVLETEGVEAVIHFAASAYVGESMMDPQKYFRNNVVGTVSLLDAVRAAGVRKMIFSSTCATYGTPSELPITEDHPQKPVNPYGESKLFVERMLEWNAMAGGLRYVVLRYFNAAGADPGGELGEEHDPETHLIPLAMLAALGRKPALEVYGSDYPTHDGTAVRDYVHVTDLARAHVRAMRYLEQGGENAAINVGTGRGVSVREVIDMVQAVAGRPVPVQMRPRRAGDPAELVADPARAEAILGWRPKYSDLETIVRTAWHWHSTRSMIPAFDGAAAGMARTYLANRA